jgi:NAD(P)H-dependent FMN reductase
MASVRKGRFGPVVTDWFLKRAGERRDVVVDLIDLREYDLPMALSGGAAVDAFAARIHAADAIVIITPEYNHGYPGALKTALDSLHAEWHAKPVGFVSYGGIAGGLRSVEQLRAVVSELHAISIRETVSFAHAWEQFDANGELIDAESADHAATGLIDKLIWWGRALRSAREVSPYQAG